MNQLLTLVLSILGATSGLTAFGAFLHSVFSERAKVKLTDLSNKKGYYNMFFKNQFVGCMSKMNAYAYIQISNNSKLPICITNVKIAHKNMDYDVSQRHIDHECKFVLDGYKKSFNETAIKENQLIFPCQLQPFGYVEGFAFFHVFPDLDIGKDVSFSLIVETNRKRSFSEKINFLCEKHALELMTKERKRQEELGLIERGI